MKIFPLKTYQLSLAITLTLVASLPNANADDILYKIAPVKVDYKPSSTTVDPGFNPVIAKQLQDFVNAQVTTNKKPSIVLLVGNRGKFWRGVAGINRVGTTLPRKFVDNFKIGSNTKMYTAALVMQLVQNGKIGLGDTMNKWFSDEAWFAKMPNGNKITVKHLLSHESGLYNYVKSQDVIQNMIQKTPLKVFSPQDLLAVSFAQPAEFLPGTHYHYSNTGYILLGLIVEKVLGMKVETAIHTNVLARLKLNHSYMLNDPGLPFPYVHGHAYYKEGDSFKITSYIDPSVSWTAGSIIANPNDLDTFNKAQLSNGFLTPATQTKRQTYNPLSATSFQLGSTPGVFEYGLGISRMRFANDQYIGHFGQIEGYDTAVFYNPKKDISFVLNMTDMGPLSKHTTFEEALNLLAILLANGTVKKSATLELQFNKWDIPHGETAKDHLMGLGTL
jgi:D-alanyl-D-alanine carboxypeptidase